MRALLIVVTMLLATASAEPTLTEAQAIAAAKAWVKAVRAGNVAALAKLSAAPLPVAVDMQGCKLDKTVGKGELAKHAPCLQKSIGKVKWRDDRWHGALRDGAWHVEQTLADESFHIALAVSAGRVVRVQASFSFAGP